MKSLKDNYDDKQNVISDKVKFITPTKSKYFSEIIESNKITPCKILLSPSKNDIIKYTGIENLKKDDNVTFYTRAEYEIKLLYSMKNNLLINYNLKNVSKIHNDINNKDFIKIKKEYNKK